MTDWDNDEYDGEYARPARPRVKNFANAITTAGLLASLYMSLVLAGWDPMGIGFFGGFVLMGSVGVGVAGVLAAAISRSRNAVIYAVSTVSLAALLIVTAIRQTSSPAKPHDAAKSQQYVGQYFDQLENKLGPVTSESWDKANRHYYHLPGIKVQVDEEGIVRSVEPDQ